MQQVLGLRHIRRIRRRCRHRVHQARIDVDPNVGLHSEVPLVALLGLVHLRIARAVGVLRRTRRGDDRRIDHGAPRSSKPLRVRSALTASRIFGARSCFSSRCRKFSSVVSSGIALVMRKRANWRSGVISYSASSIAGSEKPNQFCIRWMRSMVASGYGRRPLCGGALHWHALSGPEPTARKFANANGSCRAGRLGSATAMVPARDRSASERCNYALRTPEGEQLTCVKSR